MYKEFNSMFYFTEVKEGITYSDPFIHKYCKYLKRNNKAFKTIETYAKAIHKFWLYSLYFPAKKDEDFLDYISKYVEVITKTGFTIEKNTRFLTSIDSKYSINSFKKCKNIKKDIVALKDYFTYICDKRLNVNFHLIDSNLNLELYYGDTLNKKNFNAKIKYSKGSSYGLKPSPAMKKVMMDRVTAFDVLSKNIKNTKINLTADNGQIFPLVTFDALLSVSTPRNKLFYLMCGALSARASQALTFTIFDVNIEKKEVYLVDPLTDKDNGYIKKPRREILKNFNINFANKPYKTKINGFKYDIPSENSQSRALTFLPSYEDVFFKAYFDWSKDLDSSSPLVFQTFPRTGGVGLLSYSNAYERFIKDIELVKKKYPSLKETLDKYNNGLHGLRHMYGCTMADYAYFINLEENKDLKAKIGWNFTPAEVKEMIMAAMGHVTEKANSIYFKKSRFVYGEIKRRFEKKQDLIMPQLIKLQKNVIDLEAKVS